MTIKTMQDEWREYRDHAYPKGIEAIQNRETHQAFFAGALAVFGAMNRLSDLPEEQAIQALAKLQREVTEICRLRGLILKSQN